VFGSTGGVDEANDEGSARSHQNNSRSISWCGKKEKSRLPDQSVSMTGYSRWYARLVLRHEGRRLQTNKRTILLAVREQAKKRRRGSFYDAKVQTALVKLWRIMDHICGKRLQLLAAGTHPHPRAPQ